MPARELPRINPFRVPDLGLEFSDRRDASLADEAAARRGFQRWTIQEWNEKQPRPRRNCDDHAATRVEIARRWDEWTAANPHGTRDEFEQLGLTVVDETCADPRAPRIRLIARGARGVSGMATLENIVVLEETPAIITVRTMPVPGFPPGTRRHVPQAWGIFSRHLLDHELEFADGRLLEVAELFFPDDADSNAEPVGDNGMAELWVEILKGGAAAEMSGRRNVPKRVASKRSKRRRPGRPIGGGRGAR